MNNAYMYIPVKAAEPEKLSFYMDGFLITTEYDSDEYYAIEKDVEDEC